MPGEDDEPRERDPVIIGVNKFRVNFMRDFLLRNSQNLEDYSITTNNTIINKNKM